MTEFQKECRIVVQVYNKYIFEVLRIHIVLVFFAEIQMKILGQYPKDMFGNLQNHDIQAHILSLPISEIQGFTIFHPFDGYAMGHD